MSGLSDRALDARLLRFRSRPGSEPALALANDLLEAGRATDALDIATAALLERPTDLELRILEGRAHLELGDLLKAQATLLEAAKAGQHAAPFRWLGEVLLRRGDPARAVKVLERARALAPGDRAISELLARASGREEAPAPRTPARPKPSDDEAEESTTIAMVPNIPRAPSSAGATRAPSSAGIARAPSSAGAAGAPSSAGAARAPSSAGLARAPSSAGAVAAPSSAGVARAPSSAGLARAPSSAGAVGAPSSAGATAAPSSAGVARAPSSAGAVGAPSSAGATAAPFFAPSSPNAGYSPSSAGAVGAPDEHVPDTLFPSSPGVQGPPQAASASGDLDAASTPGALEAPLPPAPRAAFGSSPGALEAGAPSVANARASAFGVGPIDDEPEPERPKTAPPPRARPPEPRAMPRPMPPPAVLSPPRPPPVVSPITAPALIAPPSAASSAGGELAATSPGGFEAPTRSGTAQQAARRSTAPEVGFVAPGAPSPFEPAPFEPAPLEPSLFEPATATPHTSPGALRAPAAFDAPAVEEDALGQDAFADEPPLAPRGREHAPYDAPEDDVPAPIEADVEVGADAGTSEDVDEVLAMLQREGIFEAPGAASAAEWAKRSESKPDRTKVGWVIGSVWVLVIGLAIGGYFGMQAYFEHQHAEGARLVEQARAEARAGDHERLVDAERHLREARDLDAHATSNPTLLLFVHSQRALEDGAFDVGFLRPTIERGERMGAEPAYVGAARAVLALGEGDLPAARSAIEVALAAAPEDAFILYVAGRVGQRLGTEGALAQLEQAVERDEALACASIALAEARHDEGRHEDAITLLDGVLTRDERNLRARLWRAYFQADEVEVEPGLAALTELEPRLEQGAPTDVVLLQLTRARLERRAGRHEPAGAAVEAALRAGAQEPRLLGLVARAAQAEGRLLEAETAATAAVRGSPANPELRKLLAGIYLDRRSGARALEALGQLSANDPDVLVMTARASLLVGTPEALAGATAALDAFVADHEDAGVEVRALRIRLALLTLDAGAQGADAQLRTLLESARALGRDNPGDPLAALALGEVALRARDAEAATRALETVVAAAPDDAEGHYLLGRARRLRGDTAGARQSLERAVALRAEHLEARLALAQILLDSGEYAAAETMYGELTRTPGASQGSSIALTARLGRVEALIGLGRLDDARVQLEGVRPEDRELQSAVWTGARLALAQRRYGDAIGALRPLSEPESAPASVLALYGEALIGVGEVDAALAAFERALAADSGSPEALIGRAELHVRGDRGREALSLLDRAASALETRARPASLRARMLMLRGRAWLAERRTPEARDTLRSASELPGAPPETWFWLAEALTSSNAAQAREAYQHYLDGGQTDDALAARARRALSR